MMRINKFIAKSGIASRRKADELIVQGRIKVNGNIISELGIEIDENHDIVKFDDKIIEIVEKKYYLMLNKPVDYACTNSKKFDDKIIFDLIDIDTKLFSIGRLDKDSRGLILITNDGDIYNKVIHPRAKIFKTYIVHLDKKFLPRHKFILENGVDIGGYITNKAKLKILSDRMIEIQIDEGKNRQVRKMFKTLNYKVLDLNRIKIGKLNLNNLGIGKYRHLTSEEIEYLKGL